MGVFANGSRFAAVIAAICMLCFSLFACASGSRSGEELIWETAIPVSSVPEPEPEETLEAEFSLCYAIVPISIRPDASYNNSPIGLLLSGECAVCIAEQENGWDRILYGDLEGYAEHRYLTADATLCADRSYCFADPTREGYPDGWLEAFNRNLFALQKEFPSGSYWNHRGGAENGVSDQPCNHALYGEIYCNKNHAKTALFLGFDYGTQCSGFSGLLSDRIFGSDAPITAFKSYRDLKIGDQARINQDSHTVFILDKTDEYVVVAECNADYQTCRIDWGRVIPQYRLNGVYLTREA